jgi:hypothetical protein
MESVKSTFKDVVKDMYDDYCNEISLILIQYNKMEEQCNEIIKSLQKHIHTTDTCKSIEKLIFDKAITFGNRGKVYLDIERYDIAFEDFFSAKYLMESIIPILDDKTYVNGKISIYTQYLGILRDKV